MVIEWHVPALQTRTLKDGTVTIEIEGFLQSTTPGMPRLPYTSTLVILPPGVSPTFQILEQEEQALALPGPLAIAPQPSGVLRSKDGYPVGGTFMPAKPQSFGPTSPLVVEEIGIMRGVRLARVTFYPVVVTERGFRWIRYLRTKVSGRPFRFVDLFQTPQPPPRPPMKVQIAGSTPEAFIEISRPGVYRLTYEQLSPFNFASVSPHNLQLFRGNDEVAYEWEGDEDEFFEPGEALLFYAEPRFSRWTGIDVYHLVGGSGPGVRMKSRFFSPPSAPPGIAWREITLETNAIYTPDCFCGSLPPGRDGDRWVWAELRYPGNSEFQASFTIPDLDQSKPATLTLWLIGFTALQATPDHCVAVMLNGTSLGNVEWDGKTAITATLSIPAGVLKAGISNTLTLSLTGTQNIDGIWLDAFSIKYAMGAVTLTGPAIFMTLPEESPRSYEFSVPDSSYRAYDITDPFHPERILNLQVGAQKVTLVDPGDRPRRYIIVNEKDISTPQAVLPREDIWRFNSGGEPGGADYLIITHPLFADALSSLINLRKEQGLSVAVANVLGIYQTYGDGRPDPEAIRAFISDVYNRWSPRPLYILLVGDGSFDPRQYRAESQPTFIPPYLADVDPWAGETAADNRYVCVDGADNLPDLIIGRLPVRTLEQAQRLVSKIVEYEKSPLPGGWNARVILVADDPDQDMDFPEISESHAAKYVTPPFSPIRLYCSGTSPVESDCSDGAYIHDELMKAWNQGALIVQFTGHSSWQQWAIERFLHLDDIPQLRSNRRWPVVVEMTCFTSAFQRPEPTLDEELLISTDGGAVATWGSTGLGVATGHDKLMEGFHRAVFSDWVETLGEAVLFGKLALSETSPYLYLLDTFTLLGDPAMRLNRNIVDWPVKLYLPLVMR